MLKKIRKKKLNMENVECVTCIGKYLKRPISTQMETLVFVFAKQNIIFFDFDNKMGPLSESVAI